jgi:Iron-containing redox enzyme
MSAPDVQTAFRVSGRSELDQTQNGPCDGVGAALIQRVHAVKHSMSMLDARDLTVVIENLKFLHDEVVATEQLLTEACKGTQVLPSSDFYTDLAEYYRRHLEEERGHATWLKEDLLSVGLEMNTFQPNAIAMAIVGTQYYLLKHVHPISLLGYMAVVEGDPVPKDTVDLLERLHGKQLMRFVRIHSEKDLEHRKELAAMIDRAPEPLQRMIAHSADNALFHLAQAAAMWAPR